MSSTGAPAPAASATSSSSGASRSSWLTCARRHRASRGYDLPSRSLGPWLGAELLEDQQGRRQPIGRLDAATRTDQSRAVEQLGAGPLERSGGFHVAAPRPPRNACRARNRTPGARGSGRPGRVPTAALSVPPRLRNRRAPPAPLACGRPAHRPRPSREAGAASGPRPTNRPPAGDPGPPRARRWRVRIVHIRDPRGRARRRRGRAATQRRGDRRVRALQRRVRGMRRLSSRRLEPGERAERETSVGAIAGLLRQLHRLGQRCCCDTPAAGVEVDAGEADEGVGKQVGGARVARLGGRACEHVACALVSTRECERRAEIWMRPLLMRSVLRGTGVCGVDQRCALAVLAGEDQRHAEQQARGQLDAAARIMRQPHGTACQTHCICG